MSERELRPEDVPAPFGRTPKQADVSDAPQPDVSNAEQSDLGQDRQQIAERYGYRHTPT
jgi:hypothetical protein